MMLTSVTLRRFCVTQDSAARNPSDSSVSSRVSPRSETLTAQPSSNSKTRSTTSRGNTMKKNTYLLLALVGLLSALSVGLTGGFDSLAFQMGAATSLVVAAAPFLPRVDLPFQVAGCDDPIATLTKELGDA